jgi:hypothetical protein
MDLVTFATRVCKLLGVETMIGTSLMSKRFIVRAADEVYSHKRSWRAEPELSRGRHRMLERRTVPDAVDDNTH